LQPSRAQPIDELVSVGHATGPRLGDFVG
jgi:hypothetical protein